MTNVSETPIFTNNGTGHKPENLVGRITSALSALAQGIGSWIQVRREELTAIKTVNDSELHGDHN